MDALNEIKKAKDALKEKQKESEDEKQKKK